MRPFFSLFSTLLLFACTPLLAFPIAMQVDGFQYRTDQFWNRNGRLRPAHNSLDFTGASVWLGATPLCNLQLDLTTAWQNARESLNGTTRGLADVEVSVSGYLGKFAQGELFAQGVAVIPSGRAKEMIRYGCWGGELGLLYRYALRSCTPFVSLGFRGYSGTPSDLIRSTLGATFWQGCPLSLRTSLQLDYGLFDGKNGKHPNALLYNPNFRLLNLEGIATYNFWKGCCVNAGGFYHLWGENIGNGGGFFGGFSCVF